ncbi:MAG: hypothetical protein IPI08_13850 [Betaproteobacteria bacterium]|nr:hypothetical protein [Betaproteobacteria bacterium]
MDHTDPSAVQAPSARRRLIRGALAAPALMTLCSGSAFAAASTRCLANAQTMPQPAPSGTPAADTYLRVQLYKVTTHAVTPCTTATTSTPVVETAATGKDKPKKPKDSGSADGSIPEPTTDAPCIPVDKFYVKGADLGTYPRGPGMPSSSQYLEISPTTYLTSGSPVSPPTPVVSEGYVSQWAALRFDASGTIVGIGERTSTGGALLSLNCWNSAFPAGA